MGDSYVESYLKSQEDEMIQLLEKLVNIDSGSMDKEGVDQVGEVLATQYRQLGFQVEIVHEKVQGNHLIARYQQSTSPKILIVSHADTVFDKGEAARRPFTIHNNRAYGPGVIDMKGSHVTLLYALKALAKSDMEGIRNVELLLTSDEEIGSPTSKELIQKRAEDKQYALVMEPARQDGSLVSARRGAGEYTITVTGKAAHAGVQPEAGKSAIEELAHKIIQLHKLSNYETGIGINVGVIEGGTTINTIAPSAVAYVDVRIDQVEQAKWLENKIKEICAIPQVEGTSIEVSGEFERFPMVKNEQTTVLLDVIREAGKEIGLNVRDVATGGGSDASFTASKGIPTIDGLGPVGGNAHSEDEYLEIDSLVERSLLLAKTIQKLTE